MIIVSVKLIQLVFFVSSVLSVGVQIKKIFSRSFFIGSIKELYLIVLHRDTSYCTSVFIVEL